MESLTIDAMDQAEFHKYQNQFLTDLFDSQDFLITDFSYSQLANFNEDAMRKSVIAKGKEIQHIQTLINNSQQYLSQKLTKDNQKSQENEIGTILATVITQIQKQISRIISDALNQNQTSVDIKQLLLLINEINKIIDALIASGKYIETSEENEKRSKRLDDLGLNAMSLLLSSQTTKK